jgi:hypothetical protein
MCVLWPITIPLVSRLRNIAEHAFQLLQKGVSSHMEIQTSYAAVLKLAVSA